MTEVNRDNVRLWLDALRSGEYKQTRTRLENASTGAMCCLGVACKVAMDAGVPVSRIVDEYGTAWFNGEDALPPIVVLDWMGINHAGNVVVRTTGEGAMCVVTELNDVHNWDFNMIADAVEEMYLS